jgi:hypothetical protein
MTLVLRTRDFKNQGSDFGWTLARVPGQDGVLLLQSDVQTVSLNIFDSSNPGSAAIYTNAAIDPTTVIFDTPQLDRRWTLPDQGYNFGHYVSAAVAFGITPEVGNHSYTLKYLITTTARNASGTIPVIREVFVAPVPS